MRGYNTFRQPPSNDIDHSKDLPSRPLPFASDESERALEASAYMSASTYRPNWSAYTCDISGEVSLSSLSSCVASERASSVSCRPNFVWIDLIAFFVLILAVLFVKKRGEGLSKVDESVLRVMSMPPPSEADIKFCHV
jgi:hypothetical protein